jgi:SAM-dependent methyltransferase
VTDSVERRLVFGSVAHEYDRNRPSYPPEMVDHVLAYAGAGPGDRALEVGAGTGIATRLFAAQGLVITAVEPDPAMAAVASERVVGAGASVDLQITDFENAEFDPHSFQLVYAVRPTGGRLRPTGGRLRPPGAVCGPPGAVCGPPGAVCGPPGGLRPTDRPGPYSGLRGVRIAACAAAILAMGTR